MKRGKVHRSRATLRAVVVAGKLYPRRGKAKRRVCATTIEKLTKGPKE